MNLDKNKDCDLYVYILYRILYKVNSIELIHKSHNFEYNIVQTIKKIYHDNILYYFRSSFCYRCCFRNCWIDD